MDSELQSGWVKALDKDWEALLPGMNRILGWR
jgi:hypothetical protein